MLSIKGHYGPEYRINDPGGGVIGSALRTGQPYEAKVLYHIFRQGFKGTAIDVGAHIGNHTLWFALACGLKVYAFEPLEYRALMDNLQINSLNGNDGSVRAWPVALGDRAGRAGAVGKGTLESREIDGSDTVPVCVLDDFHLSDDISLMKIDVEGWEPQVLRGARETITKNRPVIYAEARDKKAHARNEKVLKELEYKHTRTYGATPLEEWCPQ